MNEPLWRWPELCRALGLQEVAGPDISGISIDSRTVAEGDLFIALTGDPGPRFNASQRSERDGHDFIESALTRGAAGVLSHDGLARDCPELKVEDTLDGLWQLGRAARQRLQCPVIAVTGSSGKTTTKTLLSVALGAFSTPGSLNNHLGVPLSLSRTPATVPAAVFELGTNHPGEIGPLSELVQPDVAVVLNVHPAHAEFFADRAELTHEKLSIFKGLSDKGVLVVEDEIDASSIPQGLSVLRFGASTDAHIRLLASDGQRANYEVAGQTLSAHVPGGGAHRATSLAAVLAVQLALKVEFDPALDLEDELIPRGRGNQITARGITLIDDSYNANPASMAAALRSLGDVPGRKFALLGEMLELGDEAEAHHLSLVPLCQDLDGLICVGAGMMPLVEALDPDVVSYYDEPGSDLLARLKEELSDGDTLLVKGSNRVFWARDFVSRISRMLTS